MHHSANFTEHLYEPGAVLNPAGLKKPHTLISRSLQIGEEDRIQGRWRLLLLKDGLAKGGEDGRREGVQAWWGWGKALCGRGWWGRVAHLGPSLEFSTPCSLLGPCSQLKSNNLGPRLPTACHVPAQSFFEIWSCS